MHWIKINERLLEMERQLKVIKDDPILFEQFKIEWNSLLDSKVAGILSRKKYDKESKPTTKTKEPKEEGGTEVNASLLHGHLDEKEAQ